MAAIEQPVAVRLRELRRKVAQRLSSKLPEEDAQHDLEVVHLGGSDMSVRQILKRD